MTLRQFAAALCLAIVATPGVLSAAPYQTSNFTVVAPTPELAKRFGDMAEYYRREKAMEWLGREMPRWSAPCPLHVQIVQGSAGGATTFSYFSSGNGIASRQMEIKGDVKQLLNSVLPHEITHTVLAEHFGRPVPRWADEGGSVLSENDEERYNHDLRCRELLNLGRGIPLRALFKMTEYPKDMIVLYAQGYSITAYLVDKGGNGREGRAKLLQFLGSGMAGNNAETWNEAARRVYAFDNLDIMEQAWLNALRTPPTRVAARGTGIIGTPTGGGRPFDSTAVESSRMEIRNSSAPAMPILEPPVRARGAAPVDEPVNRGVSGGTSAARPMAPDRPIPLLGPPTIPARQ